MGDKTSLPIPALADAAFAALPQSATDPVQSPFGWHVISVEAVEPAQIFTLDQLRDRLRQDIAKDRALDLAYERGNKVEDALAGGMTLAEAAPRFGLTLVNATLDAGGRSPANEAVALPVPADQRNAVLRAIFAQDQGTAPRLQEFGDALGAIDVSAITPSQLRPFAEVEQDVRRAVIADARRRWNWAWLARAPRLSGAILRRAAPCRRNCCRPCLKPSAGKRPWRKFAAVSRWRR
jgi:peptidyl-prolyl cis-trans isomerase D